jgi:hypothetical protein
MAINPHHRRVSLGLYTNLLLFPNDILTADEDSQGGSPQLLFEATLDSATLLSLEHIRREWPQLRRRFGRRRRALESILAAGRPIRLCGCTLIVGFPPQRQFHRELLSLPEYRTAVEDELARMFGLQLTLMTVLHPQRVVRAQLPAPYTSP